MKANKNSERQKLSEEYIQTIKYFRLWLEGAEHPTGPAFIRKLFLVGGSEYVPSVRTISKVIRQLDMKNLD